MTDITKLELTWKEWLIYHNRYVKKLERGTRRGSKVLFRYDQTSASRAEASSAITGIPGE